MHIHKHTKTSQLFAHSRLPGSFVERNLFILPIKWIRRVIVNKPPAPLFSSLFPRAPSIVEAISLGLFVPDLSRQTIPLAGSVFLPEPKQLRDTPCGGVKGKPNNSISNNNKALSSFPARGTEDLQWPWHTRGQLLNAYYLSFTSCTMSPNQTMQE